ncbi:MAG TPA: adenylate/guanylate cyclase domain-containing protein [Gemmatimonadota bacterium]|nr:adenylate/guanylate cyclase domain-containing protein [Gemmatimonadota bacterium]
MNNRASSRLPHRVSVVWFSDLVGWSNLTAADEDHAISLVRRFQAAVRAVVAEDQGRIVNFIGDAALVESPSAEAAVMAAAELRGLMQAGETIRTGVHLGDVAVAPDGDLYGDGVNTAQRIQTVAEPGQIVVSGDVWRQLRNRSTFRFEPLGERELKGVEALDLYLVLEAGKTATTARMPATTPDGGAKAAITDAHAPVERSIAVLPFINLSSDAENEYFSDGITEEILNALVKVSDLKVASRTSSFAFKGHQGDVREIAEKLGVATVLEGSVRKAGNRVRITGQLIGAADGYHLWSETYDRQLEDIFAIQDDIAQAIVTALKATLAVDEGEKLVTATTDNLEAYTLYLKGRFAFNKFTEEGLRRSLELYAEALEESPHYARAWAGIADSWMNLADDWVAPEVAYVSGKEAAARALELDPDLAEANTALGKVYTWYDWDFTRGELALRRAVASNPNYTDAHWALGTLLPAVGRLDEGIREMRAAQKLDPLSPTFSQWLARFLLYQRRTADAVQESLHTLDLDPEYARGHMTLGLARMQVEGPNAGLESLRHSAEMSWSPSFRAFLAYGLAAAGQEAEARSVLDELDSEGREGYVRAEFLAAVYGALGDPDEAFLQLDRAYADRSAGLIYLHLDPLFDSLRDDPRFSALVARIGLQ